MRKSGLTLLFLALTTSLVVMAQAPVGRQGSRKQDAPAAEETQRQPRHFSPEEFRERQQKYFTDKSGLTEDEAAKFFPLYFELQQKKNEINLNARQTVTSHSERGPLSDAEYSKLIDNLADAKIKTAQLEKEYLEKFKKIVPAGKLLRIQIAETQFASDMLKELQRPAPQMMQIPGRRFFPWSNSQNRQMPFSGTPHGNGQQSGQGSSHWQIPQSQM